ncbi:MAG: outer membrane lipoprotein LolB [Gammaproteobacteria bacterium]|jgi:outer membrane lipoprotein LolB|nr:outer membrane lipoprotein LolB [Gammaproteobacteria bacterium]
MRADKGSTAELTQQPVKNHLFRGAVLPYFLAWIAFTLVGCGRIEVPPAKVSAIVDWEIRQQQLAALHEWNIEGRIALRVGDKGGHSRYHWRHQSEAQHFSLSGLMGVGGMALTHRPGQTEVTTSEGRFQGEEPEQLLLEVTGWHFPIEAAAAWIKGIPAEGVAIDALVLDEENRLQSLSQSGWRLQVRRYQQVEQLQLPELIVIERDEVRLKLQVAQWELDS